VQNNELIHRTLRAHAQGSESIITPQIGRRGGGQRRGHRYYQDEETTTADLLTGPSPNNLKKCWERGKLEKGGLGRAKAAEKSTEIDKS